MEKRSATNSEKQSTALVEAGTALTDTLKIAFENIKKVSLANTKTQSKISDHAARIHRLEQHLQKSIGQAHRASAAKTNEESRRVEPEAEKSARKQEIKSEISNEHRS